MKKSNKFSPEVREPAVRMVLEHRAPGCRVEVPTGVACFLADFIPSPHRAVAERAYAAARWTEMPAGEHFSALEESVAIRDEVRAFFSEIGY